MFPKMKIDQRNDALKLVLVSIVYCLTSLRGIACTAVLPLTKVAKEMDNTSIYFAL